MSQFVTRVCTENTGGGCMVDFLELVDGRVLGVSDECIVLYPNEVAIHEGDEAGNYDFPTIWRPAASSVVVESKLGCYVVSVTKDPAFDLIALNTGEVLAINPDGVSLYANLAAVREFVSTGCISATVPGCNGQGINRGALH